MCLKWRLTPYQSVPAQFVSHMPPAREGAAKSRSAARPGTYKWGQLCRTETLMLKISTLFLGVTKSHVQNPCPSHTASKRPQKVWGLGECLGTSYFMCNSRSWEYWWVEQTWRARTQAVVFWEQVQGLGVEGVPAHFERSGSSTWQVSLGERRSQRLHSWLTGRKLRVQAC